MAGLPNPQPMYKEPYFSREANPSQFIIEPRVDPAEGDKRPSNREQKVATQPAAQEQTEEDDEDPNAALFKTWKAQSEEQKAPTPKKEPSEDELAHVSDEETSIANPLETDTMCGLYTKVTRSRAKWKCLLNHCVLNLTGKDVVFKQVTGIMDFQ